MSSLPQFRESLLEDLKDPKYARVYLAVALEEYEKDKDSKAFLACLKDVADAQGGMTYLSQKTDLNREHLYRIFSSKGNPRLDTIETILYGLGFRLDVKPLEKSFS